MNDWRRGNAVVGATCGAVAAAVATMAGGPVAMFQQDEMGTGTLLEWLGLVAVFGAYGILYVGWLTIPIGAVLGSVVGVLVGRRILLPPGLFASMFIGAAAAMAFWLLPKGADSIGTDSMATAVAAGAFPGALGGCAAWCVARWITGRRAGTSVVEVVAPVSLGGGEGG